MRFIQHSKFPKGGGVDYAAFQREEASRFMVTRLTDGKKAFVSRRPRKDSKYWNHEYVIWDLERNERA